MYKFTVNGKTVTTENKTNLLTFLRDTLGITSVKDGCSEGACGTCMVLLDGKSFKACILNTEKVDGKSIMTVEGINKEEMEIYEWAFAEAGAVQCGFCIPGMIISSKSLLDTNQNPTEEDIKKALRGNICRCTGYVKIIEAVLKVAKALREKTIPTNNYKGNIGERFPRIDAKDKISGIAKYSADLKIEGLHFGAALRTKHVRALIKNIDTSEALKIEGVEKIYLAEDIPGNRNIGHLSFISDWDALIAKGEITRYIGDGVALVLAKDKESLKKGLEAIKVEYEVLKPLTSPRMAMESTAPKIHEKGNILFVQNLTRGNSEEAIKNSKHVVSHIYKTPFTEHAYLEPESAIAVPTEDGVHLYTSSQSIYDEQREVSRLLGLAPEQVKVTSSYVGGGFGGKEDMSVQHHAGLLAFLSKKPVQVTLSRQESINVTTKRHAMEIEMTTACDENGKLTAMKCTIISDTGAYSSLGGPVLQRACTHASGPYNYHNIDVTGTAVYTNNPPGGAFRGFGVTQSAFATEANLNELAELVGISPWEIRYRNAIEPGMVLPNGQIADEGTALKETLMAVKDYYENNKIVGIACAMKNAGIGVGLPDIGRATISIENGKLQVRSSAACIGQGFATIAAQIACEEMNIDKKFINIEMPTTERTPNSGTTTASRQTVFSGEAVRRASEKVKEYIESKKAEGKTIEEILVLGDKKEFSGEYSGITDPLNSEKENPVSHVGYGYATQVVKLDEDGKLVEVVAAHDVGKAINPTTIEGQIEGGVVMGLGYALTEDFILENGIPKQKYGSLGLMRSTDIPKITSIIIEKNNLELAYGAKGIGEITTIPTAPAVQGAYYSLDKIFRTELPLKKTFYKK
jgi:selenium-dependent xanthine dehydrogenase